MGSRRAVGPDHEQVDTGPPPGAGTLTLGGVPIGRPEDAPARLAAELANADVIAAEDTRRVRRLATALDVRLTARLVSYYDEVEARRAAELVDELRAGRNVLLVTDAGMPAISDPGYRLVAAAAAAGIRVTAVPGPSAVVTALAVSGLPTDRFCFEGFPPRKPGERERTVRRAGGGHSHAGVLRVAAAARRHPAGTAAVTRRRPCRGRLPGADQGARGDQARHAGRARRVGGPG